MAFTDVQAIVLAAGKSSRFKTGKTKLVEKICGQEMIAYPITLLTKLHVPTTLVVGFQKEILHNTLSSKFPDLSFIEQKEQLGTGHALSCTRSVWKDKHILVMNGDMPLVTAGILEELYAKHCSEQAVISFVTAHNCEPTAAGYGRVIEKEGTIAIVEEKDYLGDASENCCINAGIYLINKDFLEKYLDQLQKSSVSGEWYITDLVKLASTNKLKVTTISAHFDRIRGVNTFKELWAVEQVQKAEIIKHWMDCGVRFSIAQNVHIDQNVTIEPGSFIDSGVQLHGTTKIGKECSIKAFSIITDTIIGDHCHIEPYSIIHNSTLGSSVKVGPFAHVHEQSTIGDRAVIGNFVEVKRSVIGKQTKAKHLSYLGDAQIGSQVNIGAGTITCNYDGFDKHTTHIKDHAFIGSNNTLVAPVTIEHDAYTAAGSTITEDVPAKGLAIARQRQVNKPDYVEKLALKASKKKDSDEISFVGAQKSPHIENIS